MDFTSFFAATSALASAKEILSGAVDLRDMSKLTTLITEANAKLLQTQEALLTNQAQMANLQKEHFETREKLRVVEERLAQKARYSLFEISDGNFVYRVNLSPVPGDVGNPVSSEPLHYVCQSCFDKGIKVVLQKSYLMEGVFHLECSNCKATVNPG